MNWNRLINPRFRPLTCSVALALGGISGCASAPAPSGATSATPDGDWKTSAREHSKIDLNYMVGHNLHQLVLVSEAGRVTASAYLDRRVLKEREIAAEDYLPLLERMRSESKTALAQPGGSPTCRSPFTSVILIKSNTYNWSGCRQTEDGTAFSKIVRDAEFLLYSKK